MRAWRNGRRARLRVGELRKVAGGKFLANNGRNKVEPRFVKLCRFGHFKEVSLSRFYKKCETRPGLWAYKNNNLKYNMRAWRNGRRARLRGVFERVWVQVPPLAPKLKRLNLSFNLFFMAKRNIIESF